MLFLTIFFKNMNTASTIFKVTEGVVNISSAVFFSVVLFLDIYLLF